jgi:nicotinate-nucleotide--dimethylbenzimidazole phosphoribosyltransferase
MELMQAIERRRDTRHFTKDIVPDDILHKTLRAALLGPSVGLSQPCRIIDISALCRQSLVQDFIEQRSLAESTIMGGERLNLHRSLKLESLEDAPVLWAIFCAYPQDEYTIGIISNPRALEWSCACAIQNMWLSLTADEYGAGWVTILDLPALAAKLEAPANWEPMGILCIGKPATDYNGQPMLEHLGWKKRELNPDSFFSMAKVKL